MSERVDARAEIARLARLLAIEPEDLDFLESISSESLREFRDQVVELFFDDRNDDLGRLAHAGSLLPASVTASLTRQAVGPMLAARAAGLVDTRQSVAVCSRLPVEFIADITVEIDPRRVEDVVAAMPTEINTAVAELLIERREYVVMGQFIGHVDDETMAVAIPGASDEDILRTGFVVEDKNRLSPAMALLSDDRLFSLMQTAGECDLWPEALDLIRHLDEEQFCRIAVQAAELSDDLLDELVIATHKDQFWGVTIPVVARMPDPSNAVEAMLRADAATIKGLADAIVEDCDPADIYCLLEMIPDEQVAGLRKRFSQNGKLGQLEAYEDQLAA